MSTAQTQVLNDIRVYSVKPKQPTVRIDCRTCANADTGGCSLFPRQCSEGSAYQSTKPVQYWSAS